MVCQADSTLRNPSKFNFVDDNHLCGSNRFLVRAQIVSSRAEDLSARNRGKTMRVLTFCALIIAASTFASAVENIYGWSNVKPVAAGAWENGYAWGKEMLGVEQKT